MADFCLRAVAHYPVSFVEDRICTFSILSNCPLHKDEPVVILCCSPSLPPFSSPREKKSAPCLACFVCDPWGSAFKCGGDDSVTNGLACQQATGGRLLTNSGLRFMPADGGGLHLPFSPPPMLSRPEGSICHTMGHSLGASPKLPKVSVVAIASDFRHTTPITKTAINTHCVLDTRSGQVPYKPSMPNIPWMDQALL